MKWIEYEEGCYESNLSCIDKGFIEGGTEWNGDILISTSQDVEIVYNKKRLWNESIKNLGRNDRCVCGSGKKFKKCCINKEVE